MNHPSGPFSERVSVLIADADLLSANLLAAELGRGKQDIHVVGVSNCSVEAIQVAEKLQPDIALINTRLGDGPMTGYRVLQGLSSGCPKTAAIMMIPVSDRDLIIDAFRGGARGLFCRGEAPKLLSKCIRTVHGGQIWAGNQDLAFLLEFLTQLRPLRIVKPGGGMQHLTPREAEVVHLLAELRRNAPIYEQDSREGFFNAEQNAIGPYAFLPECRQRFGDGGLQGFHRKLNEAKPGGVIHSIGKPAGGAHNRHRPVAQAVDLI